MIKNVNNVSQCNSTIKHDDPPPKNVTLLLKDVFSLPQHMEKHC